MQFRLGREEAHLQSTAIRGHEWATSGNQSQSVAIRGNQWQSVAIRGNQWQSACNSDMDERGGAPAPRAI